MQLDDNVKRLLSNKEISQQDLCASLVELISKLNHDQIVNLSLHLAFEANLNDKSVWRAIEDASSAVSHLLNITQVSQLEWATC
jgi:hypothetical protein